MRHYEGFGFRMQAGYKAQGATRVSGFWLGFRIQGLGVGGWSLGFEVWGRNSSVGSGSSLTGLGPFVSFGVS